MAIKAVPVTEDNVHQGRESDIMALFAESINEIIDVHSLMMVMDLDRSQQGLLTVSQRALSDLMRQMTAPAP